MSEPLNRISRRITWAASLRYGSESYIPAVPCVRPSQGSVTAPANGTQRSFWNSSAAASIRRWSASAALPRSTT